MQWHVFVHKDHSDVSMQQLALVTQLEILRYVCITEMKISNEISEYITLAD